MTERKPRRGRPPLPADVQRQRLIDGVRQAPQKALEALLKEETAFLESLTKDELEEMTSTKLVDRYDLDWDAILDECDTNRDGVIDFEEFIGACIDKKVLSSTEDLHKAFNLLDTNHDGVISLDDFDDLFSSYGGAKMDQELWHDLLMEADRNDDGKVSFDEFREAMGYLLTKNLEKKRRNTAQR